MESADLRQLASDVSAMKELLARLDERSLAAAVAYERVADIEKRVNTLEQDRGKIIGWAAGIAAGASVLVSLLAWLPTIARIATG